MRSGSMFGCLRRFYQEEGLCDEDPYFYLYTEDSVRKYRIFGYAQVEEDDPLYDTATDYESDAGYDAFIQKVRDISFLRPPEGCDPLHLLWKRGDQVCRVRRPGGDGRDRIKHTEGIPEKRRTRTRGGLSTALPNWRACNKLSSSFQEECNLDG